MLCEEKVEISAYICDNLSDEFEREYFEIETTEPFFETDEIPEDTEQLEETFLANFEHDDIPEDTTLCFVPEFTEEELYENLKRTPVNNGEWSGERGQSLWIPQDDDVRGILERYGTDGVMYSDGIANFDKFSAFDLYLSESEYTDSNAHQFATCNDGLCSYFSELAEQHGGPDCADPLSNEAYCRIMMDVFKCDEDQLEDIQSSLDAGATPYGYTWHHSAVPGCMQLIPTAIHDSARHRGGQCIWCGGNKNR